MYYMLSGREVVKAESIDEWIDHVRWRQEARNAGCDPWRVASTQVDDDTIVSTVFLGASVHGRGGDVFETAVFERGEEPDLYRCATWEAAEELHQEIINYIHPCRTEPKGATDG